MPSCRATACAVVLLSPVSMMTLTPSSASAFNAAGVEALTGIGDGEQAGQFAVDGDVDDGGAIGAHAFGIGIQRMGIDAERGQELRIAEQNGFAVDLAGRALAGGGVEFLDLAQLQLAFPGGSHDGVGERMFACQLHAGGEPQDFVFLEILRPATIAVTFGLPSVSVPVLSTTSVSTLSMRSRASAFLISTPACAPRPTPTMIDIGVARPSAQGQAMISTLTAATRPNAMRGSGPKYDQTPKAISATAITRARTSRRPDRRAAGSARASAAHPRPS